MKISVTQEHIDAGERFDPQYCPLALAISEATGAEAVSVGLSTATIYTVTSRCFGLFKFDNFVFAPLPLVAQKFLEDFDVQQPVQPFEFELKGV